MILFTPRATWQLYEAIFQINGALSNSNKENKRILRSELSLDVDDDMLELTKEWSGEC